MAWHPQGEVLVSASYDDSIKLWVEEDDEWVCAQTLAGELRAGWECCGCRGCVMWRHPWFVGPRDFKGLEAVEHRLCCDCFAFASTWLTTRPAGPGVGHDSTVWEVAFEAGGRRMVSCSDDATLKVWLCRKEEGRRAAAAAADVATASRPFPPLHSTLPTQPRLCACPLCRGAGQLQWRLLSTLVGLHERTVFSVDWSKEGLIASACADNSIRVFGEAAAAATSAAAVPESGEVGAASVRQLFMRPQLPPPQQQQQQRDGVDSDSGGGGDMGAASFSLLCRREQAHPLDVNCVRWHPSQPGLLASAGDDCCIKLWQWRGGPGGG